MCSNTVEKNMEVIRLSPCHKRQFIDLTKKRHNNILSIDPDILDIYLDPSSRFPVLFGAFRKQRLLSTLGLWRWKALPYATITYLLTQPSRVAFNPVINGFNLCFDKIIEYGHENGILAYYLFQKKRNRHSTYGSLLKELGGYFAYREAVIPKNTRPKESIYWELMDQEVKPFTGEIRRIMPKPTALNSLVW